MLIYSSLVKGLRDLQSFALCVNLCICSWICHVILECESGGAFLVVAFICLCVGDLLSHFQVPKYENTQDNANVACTPLICHLKRQIWGKEPARRVSR